MDGFFGVLFDFAVKLITELGYLGIYIGMFFDSIGIPIPSQAIMSFSGYMVYKGEFNIFLATLAGAVGNVTGGFVIYSLARKFGRRFIKRFGKYVDYSEEDLEKTDKWFKKYGDELVFLAQLVPGLRTIIIVSSGIWKVPIKKFIPYLFVGSYIYCFIMAYIGYKLGDGWEKIMGYLDSLENAVLVIICMGVLYLGYKFGKNYLKIRKAEKAKPGGKAV